MNFKISELVYSDTAIRNKISNMPDIKVLDCLLDLICECLQPIRNKLKKPMIITSGYRCKKVNELVGGVINSQHTKGQAADFVVPGMTAAQVVEFIKKTGVEYDQLIKEKTWVHISYVKGKNRKQHF